MTTRHNNAKKEPGFSLIEILIYLALFTILIGGTLVAVFQITESTSKSAANVIVQEDANFILRKVEWALGNIETINTPLSNSSASTLSVVRADLPAPENPLVFDLDGTDLRLTRGANAPVVLNASAVKVANLNFERVTGTNSETLTASFELSGKSFSITKALRY